MKFVAWLHHSFPFQYIIMSGPAHIISPWVFQQKRISNPSYALTWLTHCTCMTFLNVMSPGVFCLWEIFLTISILRLLCLGKERLFIPLTLPLRKYYTKCLCECIQVEKSFEGDIGGAGSDWGPERGAGCGYRDGLKHQKGRNKGSLHSKDAQSYMTPSLYLCLIFCLLMNRNKDIGVVSCSFVYLCCVMTPCFFLFCASAIPIIISPYFEEIIFHLYCSAWWNVIIVYLYSIFGEGTRIVNFCICIWNHVAKTLQYVQRQCPSQ